MRMCHWKDKTFFKDWYVEKRPADINLYNRERIAKFKDYINDKKRAN